MRGVVRARRRAAGAQGVPRSVDDWLSGAGWSAEQIAMLRDVSNVNNWHFAMLNDVDRNAKFDLAIREAVAAPAPEVGRVRVLDLGAGSGLLSMMSRCARAGADEVATRSS